MASRRQKTARVFADEFAQVRMTTAADLTTLLAALRVHREPALHLRARSAGQQLADALATLESVARQFADGEDQR